MRALALLLLIISDTCLAWDTPAQALHEFLRFELKGGRTTDWSFDDYFNVGPEYDEPGWDEVTLVSSYASGPLKCEQDRCSATVTFRLVKTQRYTQENVEPHPQGGLQRVVFVIEKSGDDWLLKPFADNPHITEAAYRRMR